MNDVLAGGTGGIWGAIGSAVVALIAGAFYVRKQLSKDGTQIASDGSARSMLDFLSNELEKANARTDVERQARLVAEQRADQFAKDRNDLTKLVGELNGKITALESTVESLKQELQAMRDEQNGGTTNGGAT